LIVLDTHVLLWWANGDSQLSSKAKKTIQREQSSAEGLILVSAISAWEIAMLVEKGRLTLTMSVDDWLAAVGEIEPLRLVPVDAHVAVEATRLPGEFHKDPADRIIVALARQLNASLVTADEKIRAYKPVRTVW
jgi:PIN domain nuclease of toxin-antitoxin system